MQVKHQNNPSKVDLTHSTIIIPVTKTCPCNIFQFFTAVKKDNLHIKIVMFFLIFAENIDCVYTLDAPQYMFKSKNKKKCIPL